MDIFDSETLEELKIRAKRQLRKRMKSLRASVPASARTVRTRAIEERILALPEFTTARNIALYWAMSEQSEIDLSRVDRVARESEKALYYPCLDTTDEQVRTGFRRVDDPSVLVERGHRFPEPPAEAPWATPGSLDLILVPALAVAGDGHRIGYGSGFYDQTLPRFSPPARTVVVAYSFQIISEVPLAEHDTPCDVVITDRATLVVKG